MKSFKKIGSALLALLFGTTTLTGCRISVNTMYHYDEADSYTMGGAEITEEIRELDISWVSGSVTVSYHDGDHVVIKEETKHTLDEGNSLYYRVRNGKLEIEYAKSGIFKNFDFSKELTVFLPKNETALRELSFETVSASVKAEDIRALECEVQSVSGEVDMTLMEKVNEVSIETVSGDVMLSAHEGLRALDAESVSGDIKISLHGDAAFTLEFDSVSGDIGGDFSFKKEGKRYLVGGGGAEYEISTVSGDAMFYMLK